MNLNIQIIFKKRALLMNFKVPYLLTFLSLLCYSWLLSAYSYSQKDIGLIYKISTTQFGVIYCISAMWSIIGGLVYIYYTIKITNNIVKCFCLANIGFIMPYVIIVGISLIWENPHKVIIYLMLFTLNFFRAFYFPSIVIMIKKHKQLSQIKENTNQNNQRFIIMIWSAGFDIGTILGFFVSNWFNQSFNWDWKQLILIGIILSSLNTVLIWIFLRNYLEKQYCQVLNKISLNQEQNQLDNQSQHATTFPIFIKMLKSQPHIMLFSINTILLNMKNVCYTLILPPYFHKIGYRGKQGYLVAIWSFFIVIGTLLFSLSDFIRSKITNYLHQDEAMYQNSEQEKHQMQTNDKKNVKISQFIQSPVSLFLFFIVTLLIAFDSLNKNDINQVNQPNYTIEIIYMCLMGLFFGGPANQYFSYQLIRVMGELENIYTTKFVKGQKQQQQFEHANNIQQQHSWLTLLLTQWGDRKMKISTLYLNIKYLLFQTLSMPFFLSTFYIIEKYTSLLFFLLSFIALIIFSLDLTQNLLYYRKNRVKGQYQSINNENL